MNLETSSIEDLAEQPPERLLMGKYGEMSNRERAVRVYLALAFSVPFVNLLVASSPTAGRAIIALLSFGLAFLIGWRAGYETLHVGDREHDHTNSDPLEDSP